MSFRLFFCFEHFILEPKHKPNGKAKQNGAVSCNVEIIDISKLASRTKKIRVLWENVVNPWISHQSITNYRWKNKFTAYRYPRVPERVPRYPNMFPWDQKFLILNFFIKLWETFVLYIFHDSKLFWKNHATYDQKKSSTVAREKRLVSQ